MDWKRRFLAATAIGLLLTSSALAGRGKPDTAPNELPVEIYNGYLIVLEVGAGSLQGLRFLLDTGTSITSIDRRVAKKLGIIGEQTKVFNFDKFVPAEWAQLPEIAFGPERVSDVPVLIEDLRNLRPGQKPLDGIIGLDLLRRKSFLVDYAARRVVFGVTDQLSGMRAAPMREDETMLCVQADLDGRPVWMIADTGVRRTILYERGQEAILEKFRIQGRVLAHSMGGTVENRLALALQLSLGGQDLDREVVFISPPAADKLDNVAGYLGPASLNAKQIVFDFDANQLRWKK